MRRYGGLVGAHLSHQQRLQEPPRCHKRVQITHRLPKLERPQHIAIDVDVARQIRIGELDLIKTGDGAHRVPVLQPDTEARQALSKPSGCAIREIHIERHACLAKCPRDAIKPQPAACDRRRVGNATLRLDTGFLRHRYRLVVADPFPSHRYLPG